MREIIITNQEEIKKYFTADADMLQQIQEGKIEAIEITIDFNKGYAGYVVTDEKEIQNNTRNGNFVQDDFDGVYEFLVENNYYKNFFVGGYYMDEDLERKVYKYITQERGGLEGCTNFGDDIKVATIDTIYSFGFITEENLKEFYENTLNGDEDFYDLDEDILADIIIKYVESDEIAGLELYKTSKEAFDRVAEIEEDVTELKLTIKCLELEDELEYLMSVYKDNIPLYKINNVAKDTLDTPMCIYDFERENFEESFAWERKVNGVEKSFLVEYEILNPEKENINELIVKINSYSW